MNKTLLYIFIFGFGLTCGFWLSRNVGEIGFSLSSKKGTDTVRSATPTLQNLTSAILVEKVLPNTSPCWLWVDSKKLRDQGKSFSALWEKASLSKVMNEFTASLPQGVTPALNELWTKSEQIRLFMMPPDPENNRPTYAAAFLQPQRKSEEVIRLFAQALSAIYPESASAEEKIGPWKFQTFSTPMVELGAYYDTGTLWVTSPKAAMAPLWTSPPPAAILDKPGPQLETFKRFPDTVMALFLNEAESGMATMATPGFFPRFLTAMGIRHAACVYRLQDKNAFLTFSAPTKNPPLWIKNWKPLNRFPFSESDPMGLVEIAFQVPDFTIPLSATAEVQSASPGESPMVAMNPNSPNPDSLPMGINPSPGMEGMPPSPGMMPPEGMRMPPGEGNPRDRRGERNRAAPPASKAPGAPGTPGTDHVAAENRLAMYRFLSQYLPAGSAVGLTMYGFQNGSPAWALLLANSQSGNSFLKRLQEIPDVQSSDVEIAKIPGKQFQFGENPVANQIQLQNLIVLERDAVTYLFDETEAAKNYLGEINSDPQSKNRRSPDLRKLLDAITTVSHLKGVLTKDFFSQILEEEKTRFPQDSDHAQEFSSLVEDLRSFIQPMTIHAGYSEGEWLFEIQVESPVSHAVDTLLFGYAAYRFLGF